ncbi:spore coat protein U domain-containing protein [Phyllobacterium sp. SB3]|uniref:Csu type fimbrial protein n=1 Tax=Phyllobacterium sp. SB3 TaxID=3156073 RepID=UPI0032AFF5AB
MKIFILRLMFALGLWSMPAAALAQSCTFTTTAMSFSGSPLPGGAINATATLTSTCTALLGLFRQVLVCPNLNAGTGGTAPSGARTMLGPTALQFQLYQDSARQVVWGSYNWAFAARPPAILVDIPALLGTGTTVTTIYGQILPNQTTAPLGSYTSVFSGAQTTFRYRYNDSNGCVSSAGTSATTNFTASLNVAKDCLVSSTNVNFGSHGILSSNVNTTGGVSVTCSPTTPYSVSLGNGQNGTAPTARRMRKGTGSEYVTYGLYRDVDRLLPWGDTIPTNTVAGTGDGLARNIPVYGTVPPQNTPSPGLYTDTVVITVTY